MSLRWEYDPLNHIQSLLTSTTGLSKKAPRPKPLCGTRRMDALPAPILARSEPDRDGLLQTQGPPAKDRRNAIIGNATTGNRHTLTDQHAISRRPVQIVGVLDGSTIFNGKNRDNINYIRVRLWSSPGPKEKNTYPDRRIHCQSDLQPHFQAFLVNAVAAGWGEEDVAYAALELAGAHIKARAKIAKTDR
jgi:hypothetical protein